MCGIARVILPQLAAVSHQVQVPGQVPAPAAGETAVSTVNLLGTPLLITDYPGLLAFLPEWAARPGPIAVEFCNTQVIAMRRIDPPFIAATAHYDYFLPDGMPLVWCLRRMGVSIRDRVYGPSFMRHALVHETQLTHYFLGGSQETSEKLVEQARAVSGGRFRVAGANHRYWKPEDSPAIIEEINRLSPDVIWIGLGTPKQQEWIRANKRHIARGVLLTVGFAFDVNAGTKRDAPLWMQRLCLTWVFRISQEPRRLLSRYLKYNTWFVLLCFRDVMEFLSGNLKRRIWAGRRKSL
jgi:N-acetylglucosaminyldiphosphoundecaprenol N-acetyl-beta-D-mannosaminyltransferase